MKRIYYKIKLLGHEEPAWHRSNNGTDQWSSIAKVRAVLTRGIRGGYKGRIETKFKDYEVVEITEHIRRVEKVIEL